MVPCQEPGIQVCILNQSFSNLHRFPYIDIHLD